MSLTRQRSKYDPSEIDAVATLIRVTQCIYTDIMAIHKRDIYILDI